MFLSRRSSRKFHSRERKKGVYYIYIGILYTGPFTVLLLLLWGTFTNNLLIASDVSVFFLYSYLNLFIFFYILQLHFIAHAAVTLARPLSSSFPSTSARVSIHNSFFFYCFIYRETESDPRVQRKRDAPTLIANTISRFTRGDDFFLFYFCFSEEE